MNPRLLMVGFGCAVALTAVKEQTGKLPVQQQAFAAAAQSIVNRRPLLTSEAYTLDATRRALERNRSGQSEGLGSYRPPYTPPFAGLPPSGSPVASPRTGLKLEYLLKPDAPPESTWSNVIRQAQDLARHPREAIGTWDQPWKGVAGFAIDLLEFALKLLALTASVAAVVVAVLALAAVCGVAFTAISPAVTQVRKAIVRDPAPARTVLSVGLGSGFGLLLGMALVELWEQPLLKKALELGTVVPLACGIVAFIDPLKEWVQERIGLETEHPRQPDHGPWLVRGAAAFIIIMTVWIHGLLHNSLSEQPAQSLLLIGTAFTIPSAITYAWIAATKSMPSRAALLGGLTGAALGVLCLAAVFLLDPANKVVLDTNTKMLYCISNGLQWGIAGLAGGLAIARPRRGFNSVRSAAITVLVTLVFANLFLTRFFVGMNFSFELLMQSVFRALGWAGGLVCVESLALQCLPADDHVTLTAAHAV